MKELEKLFLENVEEVPTGYDCYETNLQFDYNKRFIHIIGAMKDKEFRCEDKESINSKIRELNEKEKFFTKDSNYLKLNLFPFNFPNTDNKHWDTKYIDLTGHKTKSKYEKWVWEERTKLFNDMVDNHSPKLIITFGANKQKRYTELYKEAFGFSDIDMKLYQYTSDERLTLKYGYKKDKKGNQILFVNTYFPSNGWLTSCESLNETGREIKKLLDKEGININKDN